MNTGLKVKSYEFYENFFANHTEAYVIGKLNEATLEYVLLDCNKSFEEIIALEKKELIGRCITYVIMDALGIELDDFIQSIQIKGKGRKVFHSSIEENCYLISASWLNEVLVISINSFSIKEIKKDSVLPTYLEKYAKIIEDFPQGIILHAKDSILLANKAIFDIFEAGSMGELINRSLYELIHPASRSILEINLSTLEEKRSILPYELTAIDNHGRSFELEFSSIPIVAKDGLIIFSIVGKKHNDKENNLMEYIDDNKGFLEKILEYDRLKTDFFSNISHELKTPLNVILGTLQLMNLYVKDDKKDSINNKLKKKMYIMQQNCYRLLRLVNNLIDMNKIERGYYELKLENLNIVKIVKDIAFSVKDYIEGKGITFNFTADTESIIAACDPDQIERIILNLLSNAIKFTKQGGEITVEVQQLKDRIEVRVMDTGIGIPIDKLDQIFDRFKQVDNSYSKTNIGSGIGLSLVKSLVEMHNGNITVSSKLNKGTVFIIQLPLHTIDGNHLIYEASSGMDYGLGPVERINIEFSDIYFYKH